MDTKIAFQYPQVSVTYRGKPLSREAFLQDPELRAHYPSEQEFLERWYLPLLEKARSTGEEQHLEISEHEIRINGTVVHRNGSAKS